MRFKSTPVISIAAATLFTLLFYKQLVGINLFIYEALICVVLALNVPKEYLGTTGKLMLMKWSGHSVIIANFYANFGRFL